MASHNPNTRYGRRKNREEFQRNYQNKSPKEKEEFDKMYRIGMIIIFFIVAVIYLLGIYIREEF